MKRVAVLGIIAALGSLSIAVSAYQAPAGPSKAALDAATIEKVKDNLYIITGSSPANRDTFSGGNVGGSDIPSVIMSDHVHEVEAPEFPTIDTSVYIPYATNTYGSGVPLTNIRIPAGANPNFTGNRTIQGIMYIESPNQVSFAGNALLL